MGELATIATVQADFVDVDGTRLFVRRFEAGNPSALLAQGRGRERRGAADRPGPSGCRLFGCTRPTLRATAQSEPVTRERYRASAVADLAVQLVERLGVAPVIWIGYSWGASIGFRVAARNPDKIRALIFFDGYLMPEDDPSYHQTLDFEGRIEAWRAKLEQQEEADDGPIEIVAAAMAGSNVEPALPLLPELAATRIPLLLIAATEPAEWNEVRARRIKELQKAIPSVRVVRVQAGHGILQDAGDEVRQTVLD
jgi:pimeloyl-ACP methyl ester carboxylesterase